MLILLLAACTPEKATDTSSGLAGDTGFPGPADVPEQEPAHTLESGGYTVVVASTRDNDCQADMDDYQGRVWNVAVSDGALDLEGMAMSIDGNSLSGEFSENIDWGFTGADCVTDILNVFEGSIEADNAFTFVWTLEWSEAGGDGCLQALGHPLPCTYAADFRLELEPG